jgi:hypothetical protein
MTTAPAAVAMTAVADDRHHDGDGSDGMMLCCYIVYVHTRKAIKIVFGVKMYATDLEELSERLLRHPDSISSVRASLNKPARDLFLKIRSSSEASEGLQ